MIYSYVLDTAFLHYRKEPFIGPLNRYEWNTSQPSLKRTLPNLLLVCRQVHSESKVFIPTYSTVDISEHVDFRRFKWALPKHKRYFESVQVLRLSLTVGYDITDDFEYRTAGTWIFNAPGRRPGVQAGKDVWMSVFPALKFVILPAACRLYQQRYEDALEDNFGYGGVSIMYT